MSSTKPTHSDPAQTVAEGKGKSKATDAPHDVSMGEDESSSDEETGAEDEVCCTTMTMTNALPLSEKIANTVHFTSKVKGRA